MSALVQFEFDQRPVRVIERSGEPWFIGRDVCTALSHGNPRQALGRLPDEEKGVHIVDTLGGQQEMVIISEAGMYRLVLTSRTEAAERFKTWVVADVLPAIRRTGIYARPAANDDAPLPDDGLDFETDEGRSSVMAKLSFVRYAGRTFGRAAAQEAWRRIGLPDVAVAAVANYLPAADPALDQWRAERIAITPSQTVRTTLLHQDYQRWCVVNEHPARSLVWFARRLRALGHEFRKQGGGLMVAVNVSLRD